MTKSSARRAAAEKSRDKYRKTTRKVGAEKARRTNRKAASKAVAEKPRKVVAEKPRKAVAEKPRKAAAEKASTTYRKTARLFEEFARDEQKSKSVCALAENSVDQTRELYMHSLGAVFASWQGFVVAAGQGTVALNCKATDMARRNINNGFRLAESLAGAKDLAEAMELQAAYWRRQVGELVAQAAEMRTLITEVAADATAPIKAQLARGTKGLHKAI